MVIKYCTKCKGFPYTTNLSLKTCPKCGSKLSVKTANECDLYDCEELVTGSFQNDDNFGLDNIDFSTDVQPYNINEDDFNVVLDKGDNKAPNFVSRSVVRGKVSQYSSSGKEDGNYHRLFFVKIIDAIIYHQRFEDVLHRFKVRVSGESDVFGNTEYKDIWVNAHGTLSGGVQIADNSDVEVYGKYKNGVFMARKINVIDSGYKTPINFQHSAKAILYGIIAIFAAIFLIYIGISSEGGFFDNIGSFLKIWLISAVIVTVLYFIVSFSKIGIMAKIVTGRPRKFPWIGILLISFVIALIFFNGAGIAASVGSALSGIISSAIPIIVLLVVLFIVFKSIVG